MRTKVFFLPVYLSVFLLCSLTFQNLFSQDNSFSRFTVKDGLPSNYIYVAAQDSVGYLWFGTDNGLLRYNGYEFKLYNYIINNPNSLSENNIKSIFCDSKGRLWVGTIDGLSLYNPERDNFTNFKLKKGNAEGFNLNSNHIVSITEDKNKTIYVANYVRGIYFFNENEKKFERFEYKGLIKNSTVYIGFDKDNVLWIGGLKGLGKIVDGFFTEYPYSNDRKTESEIYGMVEHDKYFYIATFPDGIFKFDKKTGEYNRPSNNQLFQKEVFNCVMDKEGSLWFSALDGLISYNPENNIPTHLPSDSFHPYSKNNGTTKFYFIDNQNNVWVGTEKGGLFYYVRNKKFNNLKCIPSNDATLLSQNVSSICEFDQKLLIGYDSYADLFSIKDMTKIQSFYANSGLGIGNVWSCYLFNGVLYVGGYNKGLLKYNPRSNNFSKVLFPLQYEFLNKDIRSITSDTKGNLWMVAHGNGVVRMKPNGSDFKLFNTKNSDLMHDWANYLYCDSKDNVYVAFANGLSVLRNNTDSFSNYYKEDANPNSLVSNYVSTLFEDSKGRIWIGTNHGLNRFDLANNKIIRYQLDNNSNSYFSIASVLEDDRSNLWVATTNKGLFKFDTKSLNDANTDISSLIMFFDESDGLQSNQFNINSAYKGTSGYFYFGGAEGLTYFKPEDIVPNTNAPNVLISNFKVSNKDVEIDGEDGLLSKHISLTQQIILKPEHKIVTFEFTAINYIQPHKNEYAYILKGFETEWNNVGNKREATYTNLPPGKYTLCVKAANNDGHWNKEEVELAIIVLPPFYKTLWFRFLISLIVIGLLIFLYQLRIYSLKTRKKELEILVDERTQSLQNMTNELKVANEAKIRFFMNVSHEFRTPLSLILGPLDGLLKSKILPEVHNQHLLMQRNTKRLLRLVNQLLDLRKLESGSMKLRLSEGNIVEFLKSVFDSFEYMAKRANMKYTFISENESMAAWFDPDIIDKIMYNLISNAFKYTPDNESITVKIEKNSDNFLEINITDTGIGMANEVQHFIFDRFYRVENAGFRKQSGTGIGLALTKELVELHKGQIRVVSESGKGSTFICTIGVDDKLFGANDFAETAQGLEIEKYPHITKEDQVDDDNYSLEIIAERNEKEKYPLLLIVDDNPDIRLFLRQNLHKEYCLIEAENGKQGFDYALKEMPDLIISDVMMPVMDGIELCNLVKTNWQTSHIPVIMLTARSSEESQIEGLAKGADDYIPKPFNVEILKLKAKNQIDSRKRLQDKFQNQFDVSPKDIATNPLDEEFLSKAFEIVNNNFKDTNFSVEIFSENMGMSRSTLFRKIKALTGQNVNDFLNDHRLKKAVQLLSEKKFNISEVAYMVGFDDPSYFSRIFKKRFGKKPSDFI